MDNLGPSPLGAGVPLDPSPALGLRLWEGSHALAVLPVCSPSPPRRPKELKEGLAGASSPSGRFQVF